MSSANCSREIPGESAVFESLTGSLISQATRLITSSCALDLAGFSDGYFTSEGTSKVWIALVNTSLVALLSLFVGKICQLLFSPMDVFREIGTVGYVHHDQRIPFHKAVNITRRQRNVGDVPPVYPNGWFRLLDSSMLKKGQLKSVCALGQHFAIFRNQTDVVRILDAHCPHLGANMATGGRVVNSDCLQCPFHGWQFSGETGECVDIPYTQKIPKQAVVRKWPVCEINAVIYVWHHCDKEDPLWTIPKIDRLSNLKYVGRTEHVVNSHVQEIPENAADFAHLGHLHKPVVGRDVEHTYGAVWNIIQHDIEASWSPNHDRPERSVMHIRDETHLKIWGIRIPIKTFIFDIEQIGPGNVHIHMNTPYFRGILIQTITPTEPLLQRLGHSFYIDSLVPMVFAKIFFYLEATQIERDILVWNNKTYLKSPILLKEESGILKHRRWYKQFYSENSPRLNSSGTALKNPARADINDW